MTVKGALLDGGDFIFILVGHRAELWRTNGGRDADGTVTIPAMVAWRQA